MGKKLTSTAILLAMFSLAILTSILNVAPVTVQAASTPPAVEWIQTYGGGSTDRAWSVQQTRDGGYIIAGTLGTDYWLIKTNSSGGMEWNNVYNVGYYLSGGYAQQTSDGGYIMSGTADPQDVDADYAWLVKTDAKGSTQWTKTYSGTNSNYSYANCVQQTRDGGYVIAGSTWVAGKRSDAWLAKLDSAGGMQWSKTYGGAEEELANSVQQTSDGGYVLAGYIWSDTPRTFDFLLVKTDSSGAAEWSRTYGKGAARSVCQTGDGGFIAAGYMNPTPDDPWASDGWVVKTNSTGSVSWSKTLGGTRSDEFMSIGLTSDGGYILGGYTLDSVLNGTWLVKMNSTGSTDWSKVQHDERIGIAYSVQQTDDGGYVAAGMGASPVRLHDDDLFILKLEGSDADGDGLLDDWEKNGIDYPPQDGIIDLDLKALGADWQHKDLFVEVDYMGAHHKPDSDAMNDVVAAFANAPVTNPDGLPGIRLHIDVDDQVPHQDAIKVWSDFDAIKDNYFGNASQRSSPNSYFTLEAKKMAYRYCLFAHQLSFNDTGTWEVSRCSGVAELPGNDFIVSLGKFTYGWGTRDEQAGTFMHELGHNLNLCHGGGDDINYKPNYLSIMSYSFQFPYKNPWRPLDYSRSRLYTLYEGSLDEPLGIQAGAEEAKSWKYTVWNDSTDAYTIGLVDKPLDWNGDGDDGKDYLVRANINNFPGWKYISDEKEILTGYDDWANLKLTFGNADNFADGVHVGVASNEITSEIVQAMRESVLTMHEVAIFNVTSPSPIWSPGNALSVSFALGNLGGSDENVSVTIYANTTTVASSQLTVKAGNLTTLTLPYTGQTLTPGNYTLKAVVSQVANETYTADNTISGSVITVTGTIPELNPTTLLVTFFIVSCALILVFRKNKTRTLQLAS